MQPLQNKYPEIEKYNIDNPNDSQNFRLTRFQEGSTPEEKTDALARKIVAAENAINNSAAEKITSAMLRIQPEDPIDRLEHYCPGYRNDPRALTKLDRDRWNELVENIGTLGLDLSDAIDLCRRMNMCSRSCGEKRPENHFEGLGFIEKIRRCENINDRAALASEIAEAGYWAAKGLEENFHRLGIVEDILACESFEERLELCVTIKSNNGYWLSTAIKDKFSELGFVEDILACKNFNERLELCDTIATRLYWGEDALKKNFNKLGFVEDILACKNFNERLDLWQPITTSLFWGKDELKKKFNKLGFVEDIFACKNTIERLEFCDALTTHCYWAGDALIENFGKLGFVEDILAYRDFNDRVLLCEILRKTRFFWLTKGMIENFSKLGFVEDILACRDFNDRVQLCDTLIANCCWAREGLEANFDKLGFVEKILENDTPIARMRQCNEVASQSRWMAARLAENFSKFGWVNDILACGNVNDRLALSCELAALGEWAAIGLATSIGELGLDGVAVSERLKLISIIASQLGPSNQLLQNHFSSLGLIEEIQGCGNNQDRFALCMQIARMHNSLARALAEHISRLNLNEGSASERFALCQCIASQGKEAAIALAENFDDFNLKGTDASQLIAIWKEISAYGDVNTAFSFMLKLEDLGVVSGPFAKQIVLYRGITRQDEYLTTKMVNTLDQLSIVPSSIKERLILEFLVPSCHLHPQYYSAAFRVENSTFPLALKPLVSFLIMKEEELKESDFQAVEDSLSQIESLSFLMPIYRKIQESGYARTSLTQWIAYTAAVLYNLEEEQILSIGKSGILENIFSQRNPKDRFTFVRELSQISHQDLDKMPPNPMSKAKGAGASKPIQWPRLAWILCKGMQNAGFANQDTEDIYKLISEQREFRDTTRFGHLVQLIFSIIEEGPYAAEEAEVIGKTIKNIFKKEVLAESGKKNEAQRRDIHKISNDLQTLSVIIKVFRKKEFLRCLNEQVNYESFFQNKFQSLFEVGEIKDFSARYHETFGTFRDKVAIYTYLRSVLELGEGERGGVRKALNDYVRAVLDGTFSQIRYDEQKSDHLKVVFGYGKGIKEAWLDKGVEENVLALEAAEPTPQRDYKAFFKQKIFEDKHLDPASFPLLRDFLEGEINASKLETGLDDPMAAFQIHAIELCNNNITPETFVKNVLALKIPLDEFQNDMKALTSQKKSGSYVISESDDPCDLLLIGTEINGSCQRVDGSPELNKCLAAYLMNGEIIPIVVKEKGQAGIVARAMLRLMWDAKNKKPVLLLERVYSNVTDKAVAAAIQSRAVQKAQKMGVALVSREVGSGASYEGTVEFLGGNAPFTYSDASQGSKEGPFKTEGCHVLFDPIESRK